MEPQLFSITTMNINLAQKVPLHVLLAQDQEIRGGGRMVGH